MPTTQSVILTTYSYGATPLSATLRNADTDALVATADTVTETASGSGVYVAVFGEAAAIVAGVYRLRAVAAGAPINRYVTLTGVDAEVATSRIDRAAALDSATLRRFVTEDTLETAAAAGSVAQLAQGSGGGAGGTDWTAGERAQIRFRLGMNGTATAPTEPVPDPIVITPGTGNVTTAYLTCLTAALVAEAGVTVSQEFQQTAVGETGMAYSGAAVRTFTSGGTGVVQMACVKGATYRFWRGTSQTGGIVVTIPADAGATFELPSLIGR